MQLLLIGIFENHIRSPLLMQRAELLLNQVIPNHHPINKFTDVPFHFISLKIDTAFPCGLPGSPPASPSVIFKRSLGFGTVGRYASFAAWLNTSPISTPNASAMRKASSRLGAYLPASIEMIVWRDTPAFSASSCWVISFAKKRSLRMLLLMLISLLMLYTFAVIIDLRASFRDPAQVAGCELYVQQCSRRVPQRQRDQRGQESRPRHRRHRARGLSSTCLFISSSTISAPIVRFTLSPIASSSQASLCIFRAPPVRPNTGCGRRSGSRSRPRC